MEALELLTQTNKASITLLFKDTCAEIYHQEDANIISILLKGLTKNQCYKANCEKALYYLAQFGSNKMLLDFSQLMMMNVEDRNWTESVWQQEVAATGLKNMAILMPDDLFASLSLNKMVDNLKKNVYWQTETFANEMQAHDWLIK
jgi:hypothetical protein